MQGLQGIQARGFEMVWRDGTLPLPRWMNARAGFVPYRPIWPGFAVNTVFYAVVLWLLIPGPFVLRRFIRVKRGLCPACAYPRGESWSLTLTHQELAPRYWPTTPDSSDTAPAVEG